MTSSRLLPLAGSCLLLLVSPLALASGDASSGLGEHFGVPTILPFVALLLGIALFPMILPHWWESNRNKLLVAFAAALPVLILLAVLGLGSPVGAAAGRLLVHALREYFSFIVLLGSLYTIAGGIHLRGDLRGTPLVNSLFLGGGAILANLIGTTGASMLLIRPVLRTNSQRGYARHVPIFFIFLVSNIGGALTPLGDPPLFLGYLRGVPFFWTLVHAWPAWLLTVALVLGLFFALDSWYYSKESKARLEEDRAHVEPLGLEGAINLLLLGGVVGSVLFLSPVEGHHDLRSYYLREIVMIALSVASWFLTPRLIRKKNSFGFGPILEVAALFIGIFVTMIPATVLLEARGASLGLQEPWQYFWATGTLSGFLDNAPTYVTFGALACGHVGIEACPTAEHLGSLAVGAGSPLLLAISLGAVFMGANSYIGNGPNFMVKAIADEAGYKMPSFFGYCGWAAVCLLPVFFIVTMLFLGNA